MATHRGRRRARLSQKLTGAGAVGAVIAGMFVSLGAAPAGAVQAPGDDAAAWTPGWSWTYATTFHYYDASTPTDVTINENVTYSVVDVEQFQGQTAYKLNIGGTITGGSGSTNTGSTGTATLNSFSGTVAGTRFVRVSDLALLQEDQQQHLNATAHVSIVSQGITADINLQLTPAPGWRTHDFPLNTGDSWNTNTDIAYTGGFSYNAGSIGGSGSSPFNGTLPYSGHSTVSSATASVPIGNVASDYVASQNSDGSMVDNNWWSPTYKNDAKEHMVLPLDGAQLTIDRNLSSASVPAASSTLSETVTPSLTCAGGAVTVAGTLSSHAAGQPVNVVLDKAGTGSITASATSGTNGAYLASLTVPANSDGLGKNGSRANWGVIVTSGSASNVASVVVTAQNCSTLSYTGATSAPTGTSVTASAQLADLTGASAAGRTVTFALSGGATVTGTTNASGVATATLPVSGNPRTATLTASFANASDLTASSASTAFTVAQDATNTAVSASEVSATIGDPVTFSATVTPVVGSNPTGSVQFYVNGSSFGAPVALNGDTATSAPYQTTALGDLTVTAQYLGDTTFAPSTSVGINVHVHKVLAPTSTTISASPTSTVYGQTVTLNANVAASDGGTPTGSVIFTEGGTTLGTAPVDGSGNASLDVTTLGVGSHSITAKYSGDDDYSATSSAPASVTVAKATAVVSLSSANTNTVAGQAVALNVQVTAGGSGSGTPTGSVQLTVDGTPTGSPVALSGGSAVFPALTSLGAGDHVLGVTYPGDDNFTSGTDSLTQHVTSADTTTTVTVSPATSVEDDEVTITANVAAVAPGGGSPTGTITFTSDGNVIGAGALQANAGGGSTATLTTDGLAAGTHVIEASYGGDDGYGASDGQVNHTVIAATARVATTTVLSASKNPSTYGELISYSAQVTAADGGAVDGTVQFSVDGVNIGDPVPVDANGVAQSDTLGSPDPGTHTVIAAYQPDAGHLGSGDTLTQTVNDATVGVHLTSSAANASFGDSVQFSATVTSNQVGTGKPTGYVQFAVDGSPLGDAVAISNGTATAPATTSLAPGSHTVTATYSGDTHFTSGMDTLTQSVGQISTTTVLTVGPAATYGSPLSLSASVTPASTGYGIPGGTVTFKEGNTVLATAPVSGANSTASVQISGLSGGNHSIVAVYNGSGPFAGSTSAAKTATINPIATRISAEPSILKISGLMLNLGTFKATLTSALGPVANAPVVFSVNGKTVCSTTTDSNGAATCAGQGQLLNLLLVPGYVVSFAGNNNYAGSSATGALIK